MFKSYNFKAKENDPQNYYYFDGGFNTDELSKIENGVKELQFIDGIVGSGENKYEVNKSIRKSKIKWIPQDDNWRWLYEKLSNMISEANDNLWKFSITQIPEQIQYTEYHSINEGNYDWHQDIGSG